MPGALPLPPLPSTSCGCSLANGSSCSRFSSLAIPHPAQYCSSGLPPPRHHRHLRLLLALVKPKLESDCRQKVFGHKTSGRTPCAEKLHWVGGKLGGCGSKERPKTARSALWNSSRHGDKPVGTSKQRGVETMEGHGAHLEPMHTAETHRIAFNLLH